MTSAALTPAIERERSLRTLFRRCVKCEASNPSCAFCPSGQTCSLSIQTCDVCASTSCIALPSSNSSGQSGNGSQSAAGPIAGGVVAGIVVIVLITYLVWRFCIRKRRRQYDETEWPDETTVVEKGADHFSLQQRDVRASTHTVGSVASTAYTRASNVIQIAYIPGVTNRSMESSPELIPPVPPIPAASPSGSAVSSPHIPGNGEHFFMPRDLRDSFRSGISDRSSRGVRSSVASTVYRNNAVVNPVPAQTVTRGKAVPVSVKSSGPSGKNSPIGGSRSATPPMPSMMGGKIPLNSQSSIIGRVAQPKAITLTKNRSSTHGDLLHENIHELSGSERSDSVLIQHASDRATLNASPQYSNDSSTFDDGASEDDDEATRAARSLMAHNRHSDAVTVIQDDSPISHAGEPLFHKLSHSNSGKSNATTGSTARLHKHRKSSSLNQIIEEATRRATREPRHGGLGSYIQGSGDAGPFSDANAAATP